MRSSPRRSSPHQLLLRKRRSSRWLLRDPGSSRGRSRTRRGSSHQFLLRRLPPHSASRAERRRGLRLSVRGRILRIGFCRTLVPHPRQLVRRRRRRLRLGIRGGIFISLRCRRIALRRQGRLRRTGGRPRTRPSSLSNHVPVGSVRRRRSRPAIHRRRRHVPPIRGRHRSRQSRTTDLRGPPTTRRATRWRKPDWCPSRGLFMLRSWHTLGSSPRRAAETVRRRKRRVLDRIRWRLLRLRACSPRGHQSLLAPHKVSRTLLWYLLGVVSATLRGKLVFCHTLVPHP